MNTNDVKIFRGRIKYVLATDYMLVPLRKKPKKIPGGYLTKDGRRYVCNPAVPFNRIRLIGNSFDEYYNGLAHLF